MAAGEEIAFASVCGTRQTSAAPTIVSGYIAYPTRLAGSRAIAIDRDTAVRIKASYRLVGGRRTIQALRSRAAAAKSASSTLR